MRLAVLIALAVLPAAGCNRLPKDTIVIYGRENNSGTYMYFKEHVLNEEDFEPRVQTLPGTAAVINAVSKDRRSIGYGGIGYIKGVRTLPVRKDDVSPAVEPTIENVVKGTYPISRNLFFYTIGEPEGAVRHFIDWARSADGQKICEAVGYYPLPDDRQSKAPGPGPAGNHTITVKGSDTMVILGQRWAEQYQRANPGVTVQITGGGSGTGIAALINGATNICMASRHMKPKEHEQIKAKFGKGAVEFAVAMDGIAIFVNERNALRDISVPQLKSVYTGKAREWSDLGIALE
ncbi:MAG TPA: substrate-binding domain-containing protein [Planctomycetota bacterium]|nr:substrate-binding domain-containing protein [Planctomycetota bacterium]